MEGIIDDIRWMFMTRPSDAMLMSTSDLCEGVFSVSPPIPTLRTLALQSLVLNSWPIEEFVPGEGYSHQARSLRLLTRECVGEYQMTGLEETYVYRDGSEATDEDKERVREDALNTGIVQVTKPSSREWEIGIGNLYESFRPGGRCLRDVVRVEEDTFVETEWIEGSSLVSHTFKFSEVQAWDERVAVTFYQDMFIYKINWVSINYCCICNNGSICNYGSNCNNFDSAKYSAIAWFMKN